MAEKIIYQNGDISVSNSKVVFGGNTYFIKNIASISVIRVINIIAILIALFGALFFLAGLGNLPSGWLCLLIGAGLIYWAYKMGFVRWYLNFDTSSGSVRAYKGKKELMYEIKSKVEEAMTITE